jgi:uncharacterized protein DUF5684
MDQPEPVAAFWIVFLAVWVISLVIVLIFALALYVVNAFALMSLFRKVGVAPWIGWVPYYNTWTVLELGGQPGPLALLSLAPYGNYAVLVFLAIAHHRTGIAFRKDTGWVVLAIFLPFVWAFLLGRDEEVYRPELITAAGYPPPRVGFGAPPAAAAAA